MKVPPASDGVPPPDLTGARTIDKGHGRLETRTIAVSRECVAHLRWPGAAQVCRIERIREQAGTRSHEVAYAVTSLTPEKTDAAALLALWRDHWLIENRLHWRRDAILREDHSTIRAGASPQAMAALRNTMLHLVRKRPSPLTEIRETFAENRTNAIATAKQGFL